MTYFCPTCGVEHESYPALAFSTPYYYNILSLDLKHHIAEINSDFCIINYEDQVDRFIRCVMVQTVKNDCQDLEYGVWVSLSEQSFRDYQENFHNPEYEAVYFGWFANQIPEYENTRNIKTFVQTRRGNLRPIVFIQEKNDPSHPFVKDYFEGISKEEAKQRIARMTWHRK